MSTTVYVVTVQGIDWYHLLPVVHLRYETALAAWNEARLALIRDQREYIARHKRNLRTETHPDFVQIHTNDIAECEAEILRLSDPNPATCDPTDKWPTIEKMELMP